MKTLFLTVVLLGLVAALQAQGPLFANSEKLNLEGTWYVKAMVTTKNLTERKVPWEAFPVTLTALEGGKFEVTNTIMYNGQCRKKKVLMQKTEEPGKYTDLKGKKILYIEELPEMNHTIFYCECQHHRKTFYVAKLMGRSPEENPQALEEFKKFVLRKGLPQDGIFVPKQKMDKHSFQSPQLSLVFSSFQEQGSIMEPLRNWKVKGSRGYPVLSGCLHVNERPPQAGCQSGSRETGPDSWSLV
ncbi:odorant-binding protein 2a [Castor canadensis]|uniref:Odorant-binding protein 2a n=1 Tax=Castor canadensis TaxID=51338 RepID=A0AC58KV48_CASCN